MRIDLMMMGRGRKEPCPRKGEGIPRMSGFGEVLGMGPNLVRVRGMSGKMVTRALVD